MVLGRPCSPLPGCSLQALVPPRQQLRALITADWPGDRLLTVCVLQRPDAFWTFVERLEANASDIDHALAATPSMGLEQQVLNMQLDLQAAAPALAAHQAAVREIVVSLPEADQSAAREADAFALVGQTLVASVQQLKDLQKQRRMRMRMLHPTLLSSDRVHPSSCESAAKGCDATAILYASPRSHSFREWHSELVQLASEGRIRYVLRLSDPE